MIKEYFVELGMDHIVKDKILPAREEKILRDRFEVFIEEQRKINERSLRDEEIDFEGLANYLRRDLFDEVDKYLTANWRTRESIKASIIRKAVSYAQANTTISNKRAVEFTETAIGLIYYYKRSKLSDDLKLITAEMQECVVDTVEAAVENQTRELKKFGAETRDELKKAIVQNNLLSIDRNVELLQLGQIEQVEMNIQSAIKAMSSTHRLFPDYGYGYNGKIYSKPFTKEALEKYPPKISCTGTAQIDGRYIERLDCNTIGYANRHQLPIVLNIVTAKKFLGNIVDPVQNEAEKLVGETITISPEPFPPAFPCSISLDNKVIFDYVLLRTEEILDDGTIVLSNGEQTNLPYRIKITANLQTGYTSYSVSMSGASNSEMLHCLKFFKQAAGGAEIKIKELSLGEELASGKTGNLDYVTGFESLDNEIAFIEMVVEIESYFGVSIHIPEVITEDDYYAVSYLATLIGGGEKTGGWSKFECELTLTDDLKQKIASSDHSQFTLSYVGSVTVKIFDNEYEISAVKTLDSVIYQDIVRLKQKAEVLDIGDTIKLSFLPAEGEGGTWRDQLHIEEEKC